MNFRQKKISCWKIFALIVAWTPPMITKVCETMKKVPHGVGVLRCCIRGYHVYKEASYLGYLLYFPRWCFTLLLFSLSTFFDFLIGYSYSLQRKLRIQRFSRIGKPIPNIESHEQIETLQMIRQLTIIVTSIHTFHVWAGFKISYRKYFFL